MVSFYVFKYCSLDGYDIMYSSLQMPLTQLIVIIFKEVLEKTFIHT
jgi:hypothetical protein